MDFTHFCHTCAKFRYKNVYVNDKHDALLRAAIEEKCASQFSVNKNFKIISSVFTLLQADGQEAILRRSHSTTKIFRTQIVLVFIWCIVTFTFPLTFLLFLLLTACPDVRGYASIAVRNYNSERGRFDCQRIYLL